MTTYQHGYEAGHHDGLAAGMALASAAYEKGIAAGYEAAVRVYWRGVCENLAANDDANALALVTALGTEADEVEVGAWALATALRLRASRMRAWAKDGA